MPYNLLLLPLLAGYLFLSLSNLRAYSVLKLGKDQLLLHASAWGLVLLVLSRCICIALLQTDAGLSAAQALHTAAPFPFIGTALGALALALIGVMFSNLIVDEAAAARWLYHKGVHDPLTAIFWCAFLGISREKPPGPFRFMLNVLWGMLKELKTLGISKLSPGEFPGLVRSLAKLRHAGSILGGLPESEPSPIMLYFKDNTVLVGYVVYIDNKTPALEFATVVPVWTGIREDTSKKIAKLKDYQAILRSYNSDSEKKLSRVVRISEVAWASIFDKSAFDLFAPTTSQSAGQEKPKIVEPRSVQGTEASTAPPTGVDQNL